jgi:lipoprotein NlpI
MNEDNIHYALMIHLTILNMNKYYQYTYYNGTFGLPEGGRARIAQKQLQSSVNSTVLLFIYL